VATQAAVGKGVLEQASAAVCEGQRLLEMEPSESGPHASRGGDEGDDSLDFDSLHSGDFFDAIRSSPRSPRSGAPDGSLRRGASADLRGLSDTLDGDSLPEKPFGFRAESSQSFMTDDLLLFEDYLDVLPDSAEAGADAEVDVDDGEGAGEEGNENSDLDLEKVTHEDVEKLRDFSEELGSSYYKDYKNWRMGGARGAKGEAQDALQEHQSRDGDTEAESELVINTLEDEWASLYMIPGLDDVLHKERTLEEKDDQGLAPLRSKVKRTRVVYEESPQDDAAHDDEEDASLQEKLRHKARKREPKNLANAEVCSVAAWSSRSAHGVSPVPGLRSPSRCQMVRRPSRKWTAAVRRRYPSLVGRSLASSREATWQGSLQRSVSRELSLRRSPCGS